MNKFADENVRLGGRIRKKRKAMRLTQRDLANHLGVSVQQMQKYESGRNRISAVNLLSIESLIGSVKVDYKTDENISKKYDLMGSNTTANKLVSVITQLNNEQQKALYKFIMEMFKVN